LRRNHQDFDESSFERRFAGAFVRIRRQRNTVDLYLFRLHENDVDKDPTFNRRLWTLGVRNYRGPEAERWDWDVEAALQVGKSRNTRLPEDTEDLDHFAHFTHLSAGYTFAGSLNPRLALEVDHATGDEDPRDGNNGRFDHLYGAAVGDLGPRGIFLALARTNMILAGGALSWNMPHSLDGRLRLRGAWLAQARDFWFPTLLGNRNDGADRHLGLQSEFRLRWRPPSRALEVAGGVAHLAKGDFNDAPDIGPHDTDDSLYFYAEIALGF
jgi:hypothetical protein